MENNLDKLSSYLENLRVGENADEIGKRRRKEGLEGAPREPAGVAEDPFHAPFALCLKHSLGDHEEDRAEVLKHLQKIDVDRFTMETSEE